MAGQKFNRASAPSDLTYIKSFIDNAYSQARPFIVSAALNTEYIRGNQNIRVTPRLSIEPLPKPKMYRERKVFNRINPIFLARYGILSDNMPIPGFKQNNFTVGRFNNYSDGNKFITDFLTDVNFKQFHTKAIKIADIEGLAWVKTGINWSHGNVIGEYEVEIEDEKGKPNEQKKKYKQVVREGRPFIEVVPLGEVFIDNYYVNNIEDVSELVHRRPFTLDYIKRRWGVEISAEIIDGKDTIVGATRNRMSASINPAKSQYAYVYEYYQRPTAVDPKGTFIIFAGDRKVYEGQLPFENGPEGKRKIPFDIIRLQSVPNYLVGMTVYSQILPIQDTYNQIKNRYLESINHLAIGQMFVWEGSLVDSSISTTPGLQIRLKRNARQPQTVVKEKLGAELLQFLRMLEEDMLTTAGLSQLTAYGAAKSAMRTDGVVDKIEESDQNKLVDALDNISECTISIFKKILYVERYRQRLLKDELALAKLDEYMVKYKLDEVDIEQLGIINREFLMQNDQIVDKKFNQVSLLGVYNPEMRLSYISKLHILDSLGSNSLRETLDPTETFTHELIEEEHLFFLDASLDPGVEEWHVHEQHIFEHNLFRMSKQVRDLKRLDPKKHKVLMELLQKHIEEHEGHKNHKQDSYANAKAKMNTAPKRAKV